MHIDGSVQKHYYDKSDMFSIKYMNSLGKERQLVSGAPSLPWSTTPSSLNSIKYIPWVHYHAKATGLPSSAILLLQLIITWTNSPRYSSLNNHNKQQSKIKLNID